MSVLSIPTICRWLTAIMVAAPALAAAASGDLDVAFGTGGRVVSSFSSTSDFGGAGALQPDGRIVVVGASFGDGADVDFRVTRYDTNGALDASFGSGGTLLTDLGTSFDVPSAVAVQSDLKIVAAGSAGNIGSPNAFAVARYLPDGTLDSTFDGDGRVVTPIGVAATAYAMALQPDGKIVVAGHANPTPGSIELTVARYETNGTLDIGFGTGGIVFVAIGNNESRAFAVAIQTDGKIIAAGSSVQSVAVVRFDTDGTLDPTFGTGGVVTTPLSSARADDVIVAPDGRIVVAGSAYDVTLNHSVIVVARYDSDGDLDGGFGSGGVAQTSLGALAGGEQARTLLRDPVGNLVVAGGTDNGGGGFAVVRYLPDGSLDPAFGTGGIVITPMPPGIGSVASILRQTDSRLVATGDTCQTQTICNGDFCGTFTSCDLAVARYDDTCGNGVLDPGEECDPELLLDCCSSTCRWQIAAEPCTEDGNECSEDVCDSTATCVHPSTPAGEACTSSGGCTQGVCDGAGTCDAQPVAAGTPCLDDGTTCTSDVCDDAGSCSHPPRMPATCSHARTGGGKLTLSDNADPARDKLGWKWVSNGVVAADDLGDPFTSGYTLCVIDDVTGMPTLRADTSLPPGDTCAGKPCWKTTPSGFRYRDKAGTPDGIGTAKLGSGAAGKAKHGINGKGASLGVPTLPLTPPVIARLQRDDDPDRCWQATFSTPKVDKPGAFWASSD
jgi:uncharacterized delta-60 repeat protein